MIIQNDIHYFDSIYDFIVSVKGAKRIEGRRRESEDNDAYFCGSKSLEESWEWLENGCPELMSVYEEVKTEIESENVRLIERLDVVGYQVNVPLYLQGVHTNMLKKDTRIFKNKIVNILVNTSVSYDWDSKDIIRSALAIFQEVVALEGKGYRVNLYKMIGSSSGSSKVLGFIRMKKDSEKINIKKMIFPMCHTSMQRRLDFFFRECFGKDDVTHSGYGTQMNWCKDYVKKYFQIMTRENFIFINLAHMSKYDNSRQIKEVFNDGKIE